MWCSEEQYCKLQSTKYGGGNIGGGYLDLSQLVNIEVEEEEWEAFRTNLAKELPEEQEMKEYIGDSESLEQEINNMSDSEILELGDPHIMTTAAEIESVLEHINGSEDEGEGEYENSEQVE